MAIGRPIKLTPNVASKSVSISATAGQTSFTPTGGYRVNELSVYRNGVRLVQGRDFTAVDGITVNLTTGATVDDVLDFQIFDTFNIADALNANASQTLGGHLTVGSSITAEGGFYGDGGNLTNVISGVEVQLSGSSVGTSATVLNFGAGFSTATPVSSGISTIETSRVLTIGVRSGTAVTFSISGVSFNIPNRAGGNTAINV
jgi:hypothetical protein